jgi:hypothetical protein
MQIYAMPVFDMMETVLVKKLNFRPTMILRFFVRNIYVGKRTPQLLSLGFEFKVFMWNQVDRVWN